jgi:hypothetical protein
MLGAMLVTTGYVFAIIGGIILFRNTPPDVGGTYSLMIPRVSDEDFGREGPAIESRAFWNRIGFALLTVGGILQLGGYWSDKLS